MLNISSIVRVATALCNAHSNRRCMLRMPQPEPKWTRRLLAYLEGRWWLEWRGPDSRPFSFFHELQELTWRKTRPRFYYHGMPASKWVKARVKYNKPFGISSLWYDSPQAKIGTELELNAAASSKLDFVRAWFNTASSIEDAIVLLIPTPARTRKVANEMSIVVLMQHSAASEYSPY